MESLFMEESAMNLRRSFALLSNNTTANNNSNMYGGFGFRSPQYNYPLHHPHPSVSSVSQLLLDANSAVAGGGGSFRGSLPTFPPLYSSLPPVPVHRQPPLLPLPIKSVTLPSTNKKISTGTAPAAITSAATASATRQNSNQKRKKKNQQQQQAKPSTSPKKEPAVAAAAKPIKNKVKEEEEETEEEFLMKPPSSSRSVYSLSPPPSSLPLPRLLLMRPRPRTTAKVAPAGSCNAEARGGASERVDAGSTSDHLRKILRL